jgi:hypothetical protein
MPMSARCRACAANSSGWRPISDACTVMWHARSPGMRGVARRFAGLLGLRERLLVQERMSKNKLYSLHAPEVVCIAKGRVHRAYRFGAKVGVAVTNREGFVLASKALVGNPYDSRLTGRSAGITAFSQEVACQRNRWAE